MSTTNTYDAVAMRSPLQDELEDGSAQQSGDVPNAEWRRLAIILGIFQIVIMVLFGLFVEYKQGTFDSADQLQYVMYLDVMVMMLVGFGFLMTFQRQYALGAVGLTFMITCICVVECILTGHFFASVAGNLDEYPGIKEVMAPVHGNATVDAWNKIQLDINALLQGTFASAAVLISFGALIGKITPSQTALLTILEVPFYSFNKEIVAIGGLGTLDMGGTIFIHLFGAYFGLAAAWVLGKPSEKDADRAEPSHVSDILSLVGTVFLWIYWPSFNGATTGGSTQEMLTTAHTVMALCASCITTFIVSSLINKKISTVDIQNATLAGGVAVGASSNLNITPLGALAVGTIAGVVSVLGFNFLQEVLERRISLHDSCGVHNLHGMPALVGVMAVCISTAFSAANTTGVPFPRGAGQPWAQLAGAGATLAIALASGLLVGFTVKKVLPRPATGAPPAFTDAPFWTVAADHAKMQ